MLKSIAIASFAALAAAAPTEKRQAGVAAYNANFDDLGVSPAALAPIGVYDGLNYQGIDILTLGVLGAAPPPTGVTAHSPPNTAGYGTTATIPLQGQPMIVTTGTKTKFFDFNSFYFGCPLQTDESIVGAPIPCTLTVTGYRAGVKLASQSFKFSPPAGSLTAPMVKATLGFAFNNVDKVMFSTDYGVNQALGATLLDNLNYITVSY